MQKLQRKDVLCYGHRLKTYSRNSKRRGYEKAWNHKEPKKDDPENGASQKRGLNVLESITKTPSQTEKAKAVNSSRLAF